MPVIRWTLSILSILCLCDPKNAVASTVSAQPVIHIVNKKVTSRLAEFDVYLIFNGIYEEIGGFQLIVTGSSCDLQTNCYFRPSTPRFSFSLDKKSLPSFGAEMVGQRDKLSISGYGDYNSNGQDILPDNKPVHLGILKISLKNIPAGRREVVSLTGGVDPSNLEYFSPQGQQMMNQNASFSEPDGVAFTVPSR